MSATLVSREIDLRFMRRALALAALGLGTASPNPLVGAVIARGERLLGEGYHTRPGEPHAEAVALRRVEAGKARGATLYTNLEPCCHVGRTPPCVGEILRAGIVRVVASMRDPYPRVNGGGFRELKRSGVDVEVGLLESEARRLNEGFVKRNRRRLPFVTLKAASSLDGRIATSSGDSRWITSAIARRHARLLRYEHDAVMVGIGTVLADDPLLTRRPKLGGSAQLVRVVVDGALRLPATSRLVRSVSDGPVLVFCNEEAPAARRRKLESLGVEIEPTGTRKGRLDLTKVLSSLARRGLTRVLVEGGGELHASFLKQSLADRYLLYVSPRLLGGRQARPLVGGEGATRVRESIRLRMVRSSRVGDEWLVEGDLPGASG